MFPYRLKYTESESDITNYNLFYSNTKHTKILSKFWKLFENLKVSIFYFGIMYKMYNSYFVTFGISVNFVILGFCISTAAATAASDCPDRGYKAAAKRGEENGGLRTRHV